MEVVVPADAADCFLDSACTTPYVSAPSSPGPAFSAGWPPDGRYCTSAPASPTRAAAILRDFAAMAEGLPGPPSPAAFSPHRSSVTPFEWEERREGRDDDEAEGDFAFEFSGQMEVGSGSPLTADELFDGGMIRPLKPPPRLQYAAPVGAAVSPRSPRSPQSPRSKSFLRPWIKPDNMETAGGRGRVTPENKPTGRTRRAARSVSPLRGVFTFRGKSPSSANSVVDAPPWAAGGSTTAEAAVPAGSAVNGTWWSKKWRLRDLLLFRSASEGRATGGGKKDPLRRYTVLSPSSAAVLSRKGSAASVSSSAGGGGDGEGSRNGSFRSSDGGSVGGSSRRAAAAAAAGGSSHGRHYAAASRAAAEEMRRKTMLPYTQGLFGCLGFNPAINGLAREFSSISRGRP